jgi:hypothetical protein
MAILISQCIELKLGHMMNMNKAVIDQDKREMPAASIRKPIDTLRTPTQHPNVEGCQGRTGLSPPAATLTSVGCHDL